ncbi:hypothetical protein Tco_1467987 [Tanacetum coccineum]
MATDPNVFVMGDQVREYPGYIQGWRSQGCIQDNQGIIGQVPTPVRVLLDTHFHTQDLKLIPIRVSRFCIKDNMDMEFRKGTSKSRGAYFYGTNGSVFSISEPVGYRGKSMARQRGLEAAQRKELNIIVCVGWNMEKWKREIRTRNLRGYGGACVVASESLLGSG